MAKQRKKDFRFGIPVYSDREIEEIKEMEKIAEVRNKTAHKMYEIQIQNNRNLEKLRNQYLKKAFDCEMLSLRGLGCDRDYALDCMIMFLESKKLPKLDNGKKKKHIPNSLKKQVFERDEYRCQDCGTHIDLSIDHIHPESKGGSSTEENLRTLCRSCNSSKGAKV